MPLFACSRRDFPAVVALVNLAYRSAPADEGREWTTESGYIVGDRITEAMLERDLHDRPGARLLLWRDEPGGPLLGCVWLEPAGDDAWYVGMLTVRPDLQARGLGRVILEAAEAEAAARGARRLRMTVVNVRDGLIAWYERRGYALTGEVLPFPYDDLCFGAPTRPDLSFVVLERALG